MKWVDSKNTEFQREQEGGESKRVSRLIPRLLPTSALSSSCASAVITVII